MESQLLRQLCEQNSATVSAHNFIFSGYESSYQRLTQMKALIPAEQLSSAICPACFELHYLVAELTDNNQYRGYCQDNGFVDIPVQSLASFQLNFDWLLQQIYMAIGLPTYNLPKPTEHIEHRFWSLGQQRLAQRPFMLYFACRLRDISTLKSVQEYLYRNQSDLPTFVFTTTALESIHCALPKRVVLLNLFEIMTFRSGRFVLDESILVRKLKGEPSHEITKGLSQYFSPDFRSASVDGIQYQFSKKQAAVMEKLVELDGYAHKDVLSAAADSSRPPNNIFRVSGKYHPAWKVLIVPQGDGFYRYPFN